MGLLHPDHLMLLDEFLTEGYTPLMLLKLQLQLCTVRLASIFAEVDEKLRKREKDLLRLSQKELMNCDMDVETV